MTNRRIFDSFWAFLLATALCFGGVGCVSTAFVFPNVNLGVLLVVSLIASLVWTIACRYRFGIAAAAAAGLMWLLWNGQTMGESWSALLYRISSYLYSGYKWPIMQWEAEVPVGSAEAALGMVACIVSLAVAWTIMGRKRATLSAIIAFLPLAVCLILTDTVPDSQYLMLMLGGLVLLALTNPIRLMNAPKANRATAMLLIPVMLAMMGLFQIAPRTDHAPNQSPFAQLEQWFQESRFWQQLTGGDSWMVGNSGGSEVSLDDLGSKSNSNRTAFYVTSTKSGYLYLRGRGYDTYDGRNWTASEHSSGSDGGWPSTVLNNHKVTVRTPWAQKFYYFPGDVGPVGEIPKSFELGMLPNPNEETTYDILWGSPAGGASISPYVRQQCLQLPEKTAAWAQEVLKELDFSAMYSSYLWHSRADQIANLVRQSAQYSLTPGRMPDTADDFAEWFFTEAEEGYCVHFATTATVLLRAAGIPARYVTGYALDVNAGKELEVRQNRAHAWVEYYVEDSGWKVLDPTPGYNDPIETQPITLPLETTAPTDTTAPTETTAPTGPTQGTTEQTDPSGLQTDTPQGPTSGTQGQSPIAQTITTVLLWLLACCAAIWGQYRLRIRIRRWYTRRGSTNAQAVARWRSVRIRSRILRQRPLTRLYKLAEKAKYSQHTITEEELRDFDRHMKELAAMLQSKPWLTRWLLRLIFAIE